MGGWGRGGEWGECCIGKEKGGEGEEWGTCGRRRGRVGSGAGGWGK